MKIAGSLPPPGQTVRYAAKGPVEPRPILAAGLDNRVNADWLMAEEVADPHARGPLHWNGYHLERILMLLAPRAEDAPRLAERDPQFRDEVKHVLGLRYLVVIRSMPGISPANDGRVTLELFLVDLATGSIRAAVAATVHRESALDEAGVILARSAGGEFH